MQRWLSVLLGFGVLAVAVLLVTSGSTRRHAPKAVADAEALDAAPVGDAPSRAEVDSGSAAEASTGPLEGRVGIGMRMPDGTPVPPLPDKPSRVHFGVVLVTYAGAQGAPEHGRSQREAREIAQKLALDAKTDFHGAVVRGDSGSMDDAGSMPRGVLEPAVEYAIFTLPVGSVSEPLETPRGYWIVKRTD
jgi:hypothetical protein